MGANSYWSHTHQQRGSSRSSWRTFGCEFGSLLRRSPAEMEGWACAAAAWKIWVNSTPPFQSRAAIPMHSIADLHLSQTVARLLPSVVLVEAQTHLWGDVCLGPSSWVFIILAIMCSTRTVVADKSCRVTADFMCTTNAGVKHNPNNVCIGTHHWRHTITTLVICFHTVLEGDDEAVRDDSICVVTLGLWLSVDIANECSAGCEDWEFYLENVVHYY